MFEEVDVVTLGATFVQTLVCAAGLFTCHCGVRHTFSNVQTVAQFNGVEQVGVEHAGGVGDAHALEAFLQLSQLVDGFLHQFRRTVDTATFFHCQAHFVADLRPVFAAILVNQIFQTLFNASCLRFNCRFVAITGSCCTLCRLFTGQTAEDHQFRQGVRTQTVCTVQTNRGTFTHGEQTFNAGFTVLIGFDTAHGVVCGRTYRNRFFNRIDANVRFRQFADERQTFMQFFLAEVTQVEINHIATRRGDGVAFTPFVPEGLRNFVAWTQFHIFVFRLAQRSFRAHAVILQITVAIFVDQNTAFTAAAFGHQDTGTWQTGWVILNEFHVTQRNAVA